MSPAGRPASERFRRPAGLAAAVGRDPAGARAAPPAPWPGGSCSALIVGTSLCFELVLPEGPAGPGPAGAADAAVLAGGRQPRLPAGHRQPRPGRARAHPLRQPRQPDGGLRLGARRLRGGHPAGARLAATTAAGRTT
ncbi:MAG: hypothetical protein MZU95_02500 [Desulfomicrobium escambiense]|nr:hypothetical protein [Desulfomicrobium escambiense]